MPYLRYRSLAKVSPGPHHYVLADDGPLQLMKTKHNLDNSVLSSSIPVHDQPCAEMASSFCVTSIDHVVLTCKSIPATIDFYTTHLGMKHEVFTSKDTERHALVFGSQKLNLHASDFEFEPKAGKVQPGSEDLCFITDFPIDEVLKIWQSKGLEVLEGGEVVNRTGARGKLRSVYTRDPDGNLVEVANYV